MNSASKFSKNVPESISLLHQCFLTIKRMLDFINKIENFVVISVIEKEWNNFQVKCKTISNLDELIRLHTSYLNNILEFLFVSEDRNETFVPIDNIYNIIIEYQKYCKELYDGLRMTSKRRMHQVHRDNWGVTDEDIELDIKFKEYLSITNGKFEKLSDKYQQLIDAFDKSYKERFQLSFIEGIF